MRGLSGRNVIVTGAGSGIGRAVAMRFAEEGCNVGIFDVDEAGGRETGEQITRAGGQAAHFVVDITNYEAIVEAVVSLESAFGSIDVLVNNAGWDVAMPFLKTDRELWRKIVEINLFGPLNLHHIVVAGMAERGSGRVINIASDAGRVGSSGEAVYAACKAGIVAFTKTLARELARANVQLNTVCPGPTDTPLFAAFAGEGVAAEKLTQALERAIPMRRLGQPDDYPGIVAFLASDDAAFITGQTISVSGGLTMHG